MAGNYSRRSFLKKASAAGSAAMALSAASYGRIIGANERISIGQIGCGSRGIGVHMPNVHKHSKSENVEFTAVCDPWRVAREQAAAQVKEWYGHQPRQFSSYRDLLALEDVDAVMIASCDHQHTMHLQAAAEAGKDAYCEKPLAKRMDKLRAAYDAVKKAGIIVQIGTQRRSQPECVGCRDLYRTGIFGHVSRVEQSRNMDKPYWYQPVKDVKKEDIDWDEFVMDAPKVPFDPTLYSRWFGYRQFCDGPVPQLGAHFIDLVHFITGATIPTSCVCSGGTFTWKDKFKFTTPDEVHALWIYPEDFMVSYTTNCGNWLGNRTMMLADEGLLDMSNQSEPVYSGEGGSRRRGRIRGKNTVKPVKVPDHWLNWLQCLRSRTQPVAPIEAGYQHAVACIMSVRSMDEGRRMTYDAERREVRPG